MTIRSWRSRVWVSARIVTSTRKTHRLALSVGLSLVLLDEGGTWLSLGLCETGLVFSVPLRFPFLHLFLVQLKTSLFGYTPIL